jgi:GNAT superfamily N-acetyltransferase
MAEIERAGVKDHGIVTSLLLEFARSRQLDRGLDRDRWERVVAGLLDSDAWLFLLAYEGGEPVGLAAVNWSLTLYGTSVDGTLLAIVVRQDQQRRGTGSCLMDEALGAARRRGCRELQVAIDKDDPAKTFYEKFDPSKHQLLLVWDCIQE